jgi:hypothetical protein
VNAVQHLGIMVLLVLSIGIEAVQYLAVSWTSNCILLMASSIGRNGPALWPAGSPDLKPCDFFMGQFKTDCV